MVLPFSRRSALPHMDPTTMRNVAVSRHQPLLTFVPFPYPVNVVLVGVPDALSQVKPTGGGVGVGVGVGFDVGVGVGLGVGGGGGVGVGVGLGVGEGVGFGVRTGVGVGCPAVGVGVGIGTSDGGGLISPESVG